MRTLVNHIRSLFCRHEFEYVGNNSHDREFVNVRTIKIHAYICVKCGYVRKVKL